MILLEVGGPPDRAFDAALQLAAQMQAAGHQVLIDETRTPPDLPRTLAYQAAPFLGPVSPGALSALLVSGAEALGNESLWHLRGLANGSSFPVIGLGRFEDRQAEIAAGARLAHALGREARIVNLAELQPQPVREGALVPLMALCAPEAEPRPEGAPQRLLLVLSPEIFASFEEDPAPLLAQLESLSALPGIALTVVSSGEGLKLLGKARHFRLRLMGLAEFAPVRMAAMAEMAAFFGPNIPGDRMAALALDLMGRGGIVLDCTENGQLVASGAPALRGPVSLPALGSFLTGRIRPNLKALRAEVAASPWLEANGFSRLETALGLAPKRRDAGPASEQAAPARKSPAPVLFMPTNGVGLGHARRCSLIAAEMPARPKPAFAAFPSCLPMLQEGGFPCLPLVSRSPLHAAPHANDILNYLRLGRALARGQVLVFDGGYIFDSVFRQVLEKGLRAIWIRRGLWRPGQAARIPPEREAIFERIIVPLEAFDELNHTLPGTPAIRNVGPIFRRLPQEARSAAAREALRADLRRRFGRPFRRLVVSMLGGGEASDRSAQLQILCAEAARHDDWLHLMLAWPGARIAAPLLNWPNSHVVHTMHALELAQATDAVVSAAGYNSFHELLHHRIPTLFLPQSAPYLDDQARRAEAAAERGLALALKPHEMLRLPRLLAEMAEGEGEAAALPARLAGFEMPENGAAEAARIITEIAHG